MGERQRDKNKESFWRGVLKRQADSGLSVRAFCRREKLAESAYYAWRQTIRERDRVRSKPSSAPAFVPARVTPPAAASIVVELTSGCTVRLPESMATDRVVDLISGLESRAAP